MALAQVAGQSPGDDLGEVIENVPAFLHRRLDRGEVVVCQHHIGSFLGDFGSGDAHGHTDVGLLEGGGGLGFGGVGE